MRWVLLFIYLWEIYLPRQHRKLSLVILICMIIVTMVMLTLIIITAIWMKRRNGVQGLVCQCNVEGGEKHIVRRGSIFFEYVWGVLSIQFSFSQCYHFVIPINSTAQVYLVCSFIFWDYQIKLIVEMARVDDPY